MGTQLICFIDKSKFKGLLTTGYAEEIGFNNDSTQLIFIDEKGNLDLADFDKEKAANAFIIIVSDNFDLKKAEYQPTKKMLFLVHKQTSDERWSWLKKNNNNLFIGRVRESEEEHTSYDKIATWITSDARDIEVLKNLIKELIKKIHQKTEVVLDFLHECLLNQEIPNNKRLNDQKFNTEFLQQKNIGDLPAIRDELFRQLEEQKNRENANNLD